MAAALLYMGAARLHEWYAQHQQEKQIAAQNDGEPFSFQKVPLSLAPAEVEPMQNPVKYQRPFPEIYREDALKALIAPEPVAPAEQVQQAQETIKSIVQDFADEKSLQQFNQELQAASQGAVQDLVDLSTQNLQQLLQQNPEIDRVVQKHVKKPDFSKILKEIFENPQFQQSVQELQGPGTTAQKQPAQ